jgi:peptidylprolyl isomerase
MEDKTRKRLEEVVKRLKVKGADFAAMARSDSDDRQSAPQGGEIGWLAEAQVLPGIRATAAGLLKDAVSEPVRLDDGWHVLKLLDLRPPSTRPLAEVHEALAQQLRAARARDLRQAYVARLVEQSAPALNELALARVLPKGK